MTRTNRPSLDLLKDKKDLVGAEIGVQSGINAIWMLDNLDIKKLYLIDPYKKYPSNNAHQTLIGPFTEGKEKAKSGMERFEHKIEWIYKYSWDAIEDISDKSLDFVYIDGDHRKEAVLKDLEYYKKIKFGGLLCGHDWRFDSVKEAVEQFSGELKITFNCCKKRQFLKIFTKNVKEKGSDWWIYIPKENEEWSQKCTACQRMYTFNIKDIEWLR